MSHRLTQKYRQLAQLYQDRGLAQVLCHLARAALAAFYSRQMQYIAFKRLARPEAAPIRRTAEEGETECVVVDLPAALQALAQEFPASFRDSLDDLRKRVAQGCVVVFARRPRKEGSGKEVVGYDLAERGVFSALGRREKTSADLFFSHHTEVLPAYRGQRIHALLFATRDEYYRRNGATMYCGVIAPQNRSSLQAGLRYGSTIVGTVQRISLLRGLVVWETPWHQIEKALRVLDGTERPVSDS